MANVFTRKTERAIGTTSTAIESYTVASNTIATVIGFSISNIEANTILVSSTLDDGSANTHLIKDAPIPPGGTLVVVGGEQKIVMVTGDSIRVQSNTASSADAILSILEIS